MPIHTAVKYGREAFQPPTGSNLGCNHASAINSATGLLTATDVTVNGTKLYNGSVSAMRWTMGSDATVRGYRYTYNGYGWLTTADYGEGASLTSNKDRYTEKSTAFTRNGGIKKLQRYGLTASGAYGIVDQLSIAYSGNQVKGVLEHARPVTQNGSMDFPGGSSPTECTYNDFGAVTSDSGRKIESITYDNLSNPTKIEFIDGRAITNVYSTMGEKLKTKNKTFAIPKTDSTLALDMEPDAVILPGIRGSSLIEYHGPVIYRNSKVDMVLFSGGYATINETSVTFHYYTQDYLGNNRAFINGSTGAIEQTVAYYPYGGVIAGLGTAATSGQPYKFGGKELMTANGLNEYDFGARQYYSAVPGFTKPDPMAEMYLWLSPYLYCGNNPVNAIDPTGMIVIGLDDQARQNITYSLSEEEAKFVRFNKSGVIDADLLNQYSGTSENFEALKTVVNSETSYYVSTASQYRVKNEIIQMHEQSSTGVVGTTLLPNAKHEPSPDDNVHIYVCNRLPNVEMVSTTAHELFGHGYFYELKNQGYDVNPMHDMQNIDGGLEYMPELNGYFPSIVRTDVNYNLVKQIKIVTNQARTNFQNRIKK